MPSPLLIILAGPNGAGKSTFHEAHLKGLGLHFLNADNLERAIRWLPRVRIHDNSSFRQPHRFLCEFGEGRLVRRGHRPIPGWARRFFTA